MKLLIIGSTGQVGTALCQQAEQAGIEYRGVASKELDIVRANKVARLVKREKPNFVINAAAYTAVDAAEDDADRCFAINAEGPENVALACRRIGVPLIHISTDYVFDGSKEEAYLEDDAANPLNVYGLSKWQGEEAVRNSLPEHIILRVSWVFSEWRNNFVKTMARLAGSRTELSVVNDQIGGPTSANDIARVILAMVKQLDCGAAPWGTYHYSGEEAVSWYDFTLGIIVEARKCGDIAVEKCSPITTADYNYRAPRPLNSRMNCRKILETFGIKQRSWQEEMAHVVAKTCAESAEQ